MTPDPKTVEEALRLRKQHEEAGHIKIVRELTELIVERWPSSAEAREARQEVEAAEAEWKERSELGDLSGLPSFPTAAAEKAVATKRKDRGFGMCRRRECSRPASAPGPRRARTAAAADITALVKAAYSHYPARIGVRPGPMDADYEREIAVNEVWVVPAGKEKLHVLALRPRRQLLRNIPRIWAGVVAARRRRARNRSDARLTPAPVAAPPTVASSSVALTKGAPAV